MSELHEGACRCGRVRFAATGEPLVTVACHCTGCQHMTGSAFSLSAAYPEPAFEVTAGEPVIGGLHGATRHYFCPHCLSWLFSRPEGMDGLVNVRSSLFEDAGSFAPFVETCLAEKLPWGDTGAAHGFDRFPAPEGWPELLSAFAASRAGGDRP